MNIKEAIKSKHLRPTIPKDCQLPIAELISACWHALPSSRPAPDVLIKTLCSELEIDPINQMHPWTPDDKYLLSQNLVVSSPQWQPLHMECTVTCMALVKTDYLWCGCKDGFTQVIDLNTMQPTSLKGNNSPVIQLDVFEDKVFSLTEDQLSIWDSMGLDATSLFVTKGSPNRSLLTLQGQNLGEVEIWVGGGTLNSGCIRIYNWQSKNNSVSLKSTIDNLDAEVQCMCSVKVSLDTHIWAGTRAIIYAYDAKVKQKIFAWEAHKGCIIRSLQCTGSDIWSCGNNTITVWDNKYQKKYSLYLHQLPIKWLQVIHRKDQIVMLSTSNDRTGVWDVTRKSITTCVAQFTAFEGNVRCLVDTRKGKFYSIENSKNKSVLKCWVIQ